MFRLNLRVLKTNANMLQRLYSSQPALTMLSKETPTNTVILFVPQQEAWLVERMGKYHRTLQPGLAFLAPIIDKVAYCQSLKEIALEIQPQNAITSDNVNVKLDGVLYYKVVNAFDASYQVENAQYAISQLAQTTMRSEIGQLTLDHVLSERQLLNERVNAAINEACKAWGIECLRYEIRDITPPHEVLEAMHRQVSAERTKRADILESEGNMQAVVNMAEAEKNRVLLEAEATAKGLELVSAALKDPQAKEAMTLQVADRYIEAFSKIAKEANTVVVPANLGEFGGFVASGMKILEQVQAKQGEVKGKSN